MPPATAVPPSATPVATAAPAPNCGPPETNPAAIPGTNTANPNTAIAARMVEAACVNVISPLGRMSVPKSVNGTSTNPARTVSLNSTMVMKSWTLRMKNASSTISHASISTTIVTKFVKNDVMPISSPAFSNSGWEAVNPVEATNPGRMRSAAVSDAPDAFNPNPAND